MRRAVVLLRAGNAGKADSCFDAAMGSLPQQLSSVKDKFGAGYRFYKERYVAGSTSKK